MIDFDNTNSSLPYCHFKILGGYSSSGVHGTDSSTISFSFQTRDKNAPSLPCTSLHCMIAQQLIIFITSLAELSSDYDLSFQVRAAKSYSKLKKPVSDLSAVTIAFWLRTSDRNPGTVISYATKVGDIVQDNALALQDYSSFNLFVNNRTLFTGLKVNDGQWHHVAVTWESAGGTWHSYKDGVEIKTSSQVSQAFQQGEIISGGGVMILGQEQDELGGGFNTEENFVGDVSQLNIFDYALSANDIYNLVYSCDYVKGNVAAWSDFRERLFGIYYLTDKSYACDCKCLIFPFTS